MIFYQEKKQSKTLQFSSILIPVVYPTHIAAIAGPPWETIFFFLLQQLRLFERLKNVRQTSPAHPPEPVRYGWGN